MSKPIVASASTSPRIIVERVVKFHLFFFSSSQWRVSRGREEEVVRRIGKIGGGKERKKRAEREND
jgi:hypothetical protein